MRVCVVGAGLFGVTVSIQMAREGHEVDLLERREDILVEASGINQFRLHRGYHYPRSSRTAEAALRSEPRFRSEYGSAVSDEEVHYYCIASQDSLTSAEEYLEFCRTHGLEYEIGHPATVSLDNIDLCVRVTEALIDYQELKRSCLEKIRDAGVNLVMKTEATRQILDHYDMHVIATYASLNELLESESGARDYQYELCEKLVVELPPNFRDISIVVMDGPFTCVDPLVGTDYFLMGHVVHAIHTSNVGRQPRIPEPYRSLLNRGIVPDPPITHFEAFINAASQFIPAIKEARHIGSMYTIRAVLPGLDDTDARPTLVEAIDERSVRVFSGKLGTCVESAQEIVQLSRAWS